MTVEIRIGDCRELLKAMPDESVHCVVTSPPYWGLRDYGVAGQLGMETSLQEHINVMVGVFREVRRVLRKDGTVWLNYGDCYATSPNGRSAAATKALGNDDRTFRDKPFSTIGPIDPAPHGKRVTSRTKRADTDVAGWGHRDDSIRWRGGGVLKPKDLCMIPNRLAIALQDDGWWVRSEIIWHKPNPMPESTRDRPTSAHEKMFLLTKSPKYYYDADAVRTPAKSPTTKKPDGWNTSPGAHGSFHPEGREKGESVDKQRGHGRRHAGFNDRWDAIPRQEQQSKGANLRNVWSIPPHPFREAHFATFPPALVEPCIKAGCPVGGVVLDPFGGAGTVGLVAESLGRDSILLELNSDYAALSRRRIDAAAKAPTRVKKTLPPMPLFQFVAE